MPTPPTPIPTPSTLPFWAATARGELRIPRCRTCGKPHFYPRTYCPYCSSDDIEWELTSGEATLSSYVINRRPAPMFDRDVPQIIALVTLPEGVRMMTNIVDVPAEPESLPLGMPLEVRFEQRGDQWLPMFTKRTEKAA
ncbi:OB-fold domain-containing protein [Microbacterium aquimaris]|uniref:Zn-ribbon domain-containing OB-fold protein n=1 Tax=Microbacterium aquimaris TaxID=459816 RepID=UPI002AD5A3F4|nr:OB-fold domain-containing protein [Microbacterium aquimaris]MDZ8275038.1 OB-fold domain-containing protein [Microbacterium aquimaris]